MKEVLEFLRALAENNNRDWFLEHKSEYKRCQEYINSLTDRLINGIATFDDSVAGLTVRDCTYRIYRDTRFSPDKTPYKSHFGIYITPHGKKAGYSGYYLHIEPNGNGVLHAGSHLPQPVVLRSICEEIVDYGAEIRKALATAADVGFSLYETKRLCRNPKDFPPCEFDDLLRLPEIGVVHAVEDSFFLSEDFEAQVIRLFRSTYPLVSILNRATQYAYDEMM